MRILKFLPILLALGACGVNPVTGKKEIQFVSEAQEVKLGEQNYSPMRQAEGGDFDVLPEPTAYVNEVGKKLAAVADRQLPYEFVVLNNSVQNAWALPGGKIAVNRGLLTELHSEAELAAVLGHEIVHAAARHGAKAQERGTLLQVGLAAAQIGAAVSDVDTNVAGLLIQGAGVGAQLVQQKYGRDQESEADKYGMKYMKAAGYDPQGAVTLQETFVRLTQQEGAKKQSWLEGLFASHPPSAERVEQNKQTLAELGSGGEIGADSYAAHMKSLRAIEPAYAKYDQALAAARKKDFASARSLAEEATHLLPKEGRFQELLGEIALAQKQPKEALPYYQKAIDLNSDYFGSYLGAGVAEFQAGNHAKAEEWLSKSAELLPTAPAAYYLGTIARERVDLPQNPDKYVAAAGQFDSQGRLLVVVQNRAPVSLRDFQVTPVLVDQSGRVLQQASPVRVAAVLKPGEQVAAGSGVGNIPQAQLPYLRFRVDGARIAE
jgi:predicted Zn-dependent protease